MQRLLPILVATLLLTAADAPSLERELVDLRAMPADRAAALYERLVGEGAATRVQPGPKGEQLVVRDRPWRIARFRTLLRRLDQPGAARARIYVRPVRHRRPEVLAQRVRTLMGGERASWTVVAVPHPRRLVVRARWPVYERMDALLRRLDVPRGRAGRGRGPGVRVVPARQDADALRRAVEPSR